MARKLSACGGCLLGMAAGAAIGMVAGYAARDMGGVSTRHAVGVADLGILAIGRLDGRLCPDGKDEGREDDEKGPVTPEIAEEHRRLLSGD